MKGIKNFLLLVGSIVVFFSATAQEIHYENRNGNIVLTGIGASHFAKLPLRCAEHEFPYKPGITYDDTSWITAPRNLHPAFFGCFDWHSSVHGHWMLVRLLKLYPAMPEAAQIRQLFNRHFTPAAILQEIKVFGSKENKSFERTYGWAWLLQLQDELLNWKDADAQKWALALQPLATELSKKTIAYLDKLVYPIRVGEHSNLAFGLSLMQDYALNQQDTSLSNAITKAALRFYAADNNCPITWEPGGNDFLSPCLEEANLMRKVLTKQAYLPWLKKFMPQLFGNHFTLTPGMVKDRSDGKLVHLDGLNLSRAWCLKGIAATINNKHLQEVANQHLLAALPQVASGNYEGEHWLASFAVYALTQK
jgi:hypothetical protein